MNNQTSLLDRQPAIVQLLLLTGLLAAGMIIFSLLGIVLVGPLYGVRLGDLLIQNTDTIHPDLNKINALKFIQLQSTLGFIIPAIVFAFIKRRSVTYLRVTNFSNPLNYLLALLIFITATPLISFSEELNKTILLYPTFLKSIVALLKGMEDKAADATKILLVMPHFTDMIYNVILIGIMPAIGEEFFFRGCVQQVLFERSKKIHFSIWLSAAIFSFIHFQFFGFLPRMLLGILLGYLFYYSGSIWVNILAHAFNNGSQVVAVYLFQKGLISTNLADDSPTPILYVITSLPILAALIYFLYKKMVQNSADSNIAITENESPPLT